MSKLLRRVLIVEVGKGADLSKLGQPGVETPAVAEPVKVETPAVAEPVKVETPAVAEPVKSEKDTVVNVADAEKALKAGAKAAGESDQTKGWFQKAAEFVKTVASDYQTVTAIRNLKSTDSRERLEAIYQVYNAVVGGLDPNMPDIRKSIVAMIRDPNNDVKSYAMGIAGLAKYPEAVDAILRELEAASDATVNAWAMQALIDYKGKLSKKERERARMILQSKMKDRYGTTSGVAKRAWKVITGEEPPADPGEVRYAKPDEVKKVVGLIGTNPTDAVKALGVLVDKAVREGALINEIDVQALGDELNKVVDSKYNESKFKMLDILKKYVEYAKTVRRGGASRFSF